MLKPLAEQTVPMPLVLPCPNPRCRKEHIDAGETLLHTQHICAFCGERWTPYPDIYTVGIHSTRKVPRYDSDDPEAFTDVGKKRARKR